MHTHAHRHRKEEGANSCVMKSSWSLFYGMGKGIRVFNCSLETREICAVPVTNKACNSVGLFRSPINTYIQGVLHTCCRELFCLPLPTELPGQLRCIEEEEVNMYSMCAVVDLNQTKGSSSSFPWKKSYPGYICS